MKVKNKFLELMSWEIRDNWAFPILEIVIALVIVQTIPYVTVNYDYYRADHNIWRAFFTKSFFVLVLSTAIVFGRSFGESIEKRKMIVLLSYPVSRVRLFLAKYLTNFLMLFLVFGLALLVEGATLFLFVGVVPPVAWGFAFLYLLLGVLFVSSLMTFLALATKRFGLSILIFLVYMFGMQYWIPVNTKDPLYYTLINVASWNSVDKLQSWYYNTLGIGHSSTGLPYICFVAGTVHMVLVGLALFLVSFFIMRRMDLD